MNSYGEKANLLGLNYVNFTFFLGWFQFSPRWYWWGNTAKMGMYIGHDMNEQIDYNKALVLSWRWSVQWDYASNHLLDEINCLIVATSFRIFGTTIFLSFFYLWDDRWLRWSRKMGMPWKKWSNEHVCLVQVWVRPVGADCTDWNLATQTCRCSIFFT